MLNSHSNSVGEKGNWHPCRQKSSVNAPSRSCSGQMILRGISYISQSPSETLPVFPTAESIITHFKWAFPFFILPLLPHICVYRSHPIKTINTQVLVPHSAVRCPKLDSNKLWKIPITFLLYFINFRSNILLCWLILNKFTEFFWYIHILYDHWTCNSLSWCQVSQYSGR